VGRLTDIATELLRLVGRCRLTLSKPMLTPHETKRLILKCVLLLSKYAFKFNLRHYCLETQEAEALLLQDNASAAIAKRRKELLLAEFDDIRFHHYAQGPYEESGAGAHTRPLFSST
jgi:hypothetical protein